MEYFTFDVHIFMGSLALICAVGFSFLGYWVYVSIRDSKYGIGLLSIIGWMSLLVYTVYMTNLTVHENGKFLLAQDIIAGTTNRDGALLVCEDKNRNVDVGRGVAKIELVVPDSFIGISGKGLVSICQNEENECDVFNLMYDWNETIIRVPSNTSTTTISRPTERCYPGYINLRY